MTVRIVRRLTSLVAFSMVLLPAASRAQDDTTKTTRPMFSVYGFAMADIIGDFGTNDPNWFDMVRPTKLPAFDGEFGKNGHFYESVRQTRFGVKGATPTPLGVLFARFEFDLTGVGGQAGQTQLRLRFAYGQLGAFAAGQMNTPFMDMDIFPNSIEAWGPNGMAFFRNIQVRWSPIRGPTELVFALERPGASGDAGTYADRVELANIEARFPSPDFSAHYRWAHSTWYVQLATMVSPIYWDDLASTSTRNLSGSTVGWGVNLSSRINVGSAGSQLKLQALYGKAIENYMNDAPIDIGVKTNPGNVFQPFLGVPLPIFAMVAFYDHTWSKHWTSSIGYSQVNIQNSESQLPSDFRLGQYALANVLYTPVKDFLLGLEGQWGQRQNKSNGYTYNDYRLQFSAKFNFGHTFEFGGSQQ